MSAAPEVLAVFWTGGLDSTFVVARALHQGTTVLTCQVAQLIGTPREASAVCKAEQRAVRRLSKVLRARFGASRLVDRKADVPGFANAPTYVEPYREPLVKLSLQYAYLTSYIVLQAVFSEANCAVGVLGTDPNHTSMQRWRSSVNAMLRTHGVAQRLVFPAWGWTKPRIRAWFRRVGLWDEIRPLLFSCQSPRRRGGGYQPCGTCHSCLDREKFWKD